LFPEAVRDLRPPSTVRSACFLAAAASATLVSAVPSVEKGIIRLPVQVKNAVFSEAGPTGKVREPHRGALLLPQRLAAWLPLAPARLLFPQRLAASLPLAAARLCPLLSADRQRVRPTNRLTDRRPALDRR
jgi:hypothetical protein